MVMPYQPLPSYKTSSAVLTGNAQITTVFQKSQSAQTHNTPSLTLAPTPQVNRGKKVITILTQLTDYIKGVVHKKNDNPKIMYSPFTCSKPI